MIPEMAQKWKAFDSFPSYRLLKETLRKNAHVRVSESKG